VEVEEVDQQCFKKLLVDDYMEFYSSISYVEHETI
jgi:hypothetical protein